MNNDHTKDTTKTKKSETRFGSSQLLSIDSRWIKEQNSEMKSK